MTQKKTRLALNESTSDTNLEDNSDEMDDPMNAKP